MITEDGKIYIKRFLAGFAPSIAQSVAFGIGDAAETATDTALQFEVGRSEVSIISYDYDADNIVFKAPVPDDFGGSIYEVALYSNIVDPTGNGSQIITTFDSVTESWLDASAGTDETYTSVSSRIGVDSLSHTPAASTTKSSELTGLYINLSSLLDEDKIILAFYSDNANTANVAFRLETSASNYFEYVVSSPTVGYHIETLSKNSATLTGNPSWDNITGIRVLTTASSTGAAHVEFDGVRVQTSIIPDPDHVLVARAVLPTPFVKEEGKTMDIEIPLGVNL